MLKWTALDKLWRDRNITLCHKTPGHLTVCINIISNGGISSTSDGTIGSTPNGVHVRRGQDKHTGVPYQHHLTQRHVTHNSRLCHRHLLTYHWVQSITASHSSGISVHNALILKITEIWIISVLARPIKLQQPDRSWRNLAWTSRPNRIPNEILNSCIRLW